MEILEQNKLAENMPINGKREVQLLDHIRLQADEISRLKKEIEQLRTWFDATARQRRSA